MEEAERNAANNSSCEKEQEISINPFEEGEDINTDEQIDILNNNTDWSNFNADAAISHAEQQTNIHATAAIERYIWPDKILDADYYNMVASLNSKQRAFLFDTIYYVKHNDSQLYRFVTGGAGTGKSIVNQNFIPSTY